jgi:hypothetical protein
MQKIPQSKIPSIFVFLHKKTISLQEIKNQIAQSLSLREDLVQETNSEEDLLNLIEQYVQELVDTNFEQLLRILYRIDIADYKVKKAIDNVGATNAARAIAELILEREKEKIITRQKYKSDTNSDWIFDEE